MTIRISRSSGFGASPLIQGLGASPLIQGFGASPLIQGLGGFRISGSSAVADSDVTDGEFRGLQRAINAFITKASLTLSKLGVDGKIGPQTLAAYNGVAQASILATFATAERALPTYRSVDELAKNAASAATRIAAMAGASTNFTPASSSSSGSSSASPEEDGPAKGSSGRTGKIVAGVAIAGLGLWLLTR